MPLYIEGVIKLVQVNNIKGNNGTEDFTYYTNFIQYTDRQGLEKVLEINSKDDYRPHRDKDGVATLKATKTKAKVEAGDFKMKDTTLYKLTLSEFIPSK